MAWSDLFPQWLGGTQGMTSVFPQTAAGAQSAVDLASMMNPALVGEAAAASAVPSAASSIASSISPSLTSALGTAGGAAGGIAGALGGLSKLTGSGSSSSKQQQTPLPQQAQSAGFHQGGQPSSLTSALQGMQNRNQWFLQNLNPNQGGLLGRQ